MRQDDYPEKNLVFMYEQTIHLHKALKIVAHKITKWRGMAEIKAKKRLL